MLLAARDRMWGESTRAVNALTALLRGIDLGIDARRKLTATQIRQVSQVADPQRVPHGRDRPRRGGPAGHPDRAAAHRAAREQATAARTSSGPRPGPPGRLRGRTGQRRHRAVGVVPPRPGPPRSRLRQARRRLPDQIESGESSEHRLNRGGDRQLNRPCTRSPRPGWNETPTPRPTSNDAPGKDSANAESDAA